jgi:hypothetical protein
MYLLHQQKSQIWDDNNVMFELFSLPNSHSLFSLLYFYNTDQRQLSWEAPLQAAAHANRDEEDRYSTAWK